MIRIRKRRRENEKNKKIQTIKVIQNNTSIHKIKVKFR
jgi:hypothetical protein